MVRAFHGWRGHAQSDPGLVVVVGHTRCGGVGRALALECAESNEEFYDEDSMCCEFIPPSLDVWVSPIRHLVTDEMRRLYKTGDKEKKQLAIDMLAEANVHKQVETIGGQASVTIAGAFVHGWMYDLASGLLRDLNCSEGSPK